MQVLESSLFQYGVLDRLQAGFKLGDFASVYFLKRRGLRVVSQCAVYGQLWVAAGAHSSDFFHGFPPAVKPEILQSFSSPISLIVVQELLHERAIVIAGVCGIK